MSATFMTPTEISRKAYELCIEIEKLPAGEQQTKCSILASELRQHLVAPQHPGPRAESEIVDGWRFPKNAGTSAGCSHMKTPNPTEYSEESLEEWGDVPHFLHSETCPSYCDYACNPIGFEQAESIAEMAGVKVLLRGAWPHSLRFPDANRKPTSKK